MKTIPVVAGSAMQKFGVPLGGEYVRFELRWMTSYGYFTVDLRRADGTPIALGRALHPTVDLLSGLNVGLGRLVLEGAPATINNLGQLNKLRWYPDE